MSRDRERYTAFAAEAVSGFRGPGLLSVHRSVDSTNAMASRIARRIGTSRAGGEPLALLAWHQGEGRGRHRRRWVSRAGEAVLASVLTRSDSHARTATMPLAAGVALAEALRQSSGIEVTLKWPNDLYVGGAKLGGILTESITRGQSSWVIIGFGINHGSAPPEVRGRVTTSLMREILGGPSLAESAVTAIRAVLLLLRSSPSAKRIVERSRELAYHRPGDEIRLAMRGDSVTGRYQGLDESGHLILETASGNRSFSAGEVVTA